MDANEVDESMLVHGYLAEILSTHGEHLDYWKDALCCSADVQLTFEPYDPYADEVEIPDEYADDNVEEQTYFHYVYNHNRSASGKYNNNLYHPTK